jgi:hypothetical protein
VAPQSGCSLPSKGSVDNVSGRTDSDQFQSTEARQQDNTSSVEKGHLIVPVNETLESNLVLALPAQSIIDELDEGVHLLPNDLMQGIQGEV